MMMFWATAEEPAAPEKDDSTVVMDDFDDILAVRTQDSWDSAGQFEHENDVSPDNSFTSPSTLKEDTENPSKTSDGTLSSLFPWPFNFSGEKPPGTDVIQAFRDEDATLSTLTLEVDVASPEKIQETSIEQSSSNNGDAIANQSAIGEEVPFDECIPPSEGIEVPFDECPLLTEIVERMERRERNEMGSEETSSLKANESLVADDNTCIVAARVTEDANHHKSKDESLDATSTDCLSDKENSAEEKVDDGVSVSPASIDSMVNDLEALAIRLDAISDEIEHCRSIESVGSILQHTESREERQSNCERNLSFSRTVSSEKDSKRLVETVMEDIEADGSESEQETPSIRENKVCHSPLVNDQVTETKEGNSSIANSTCVEIRRVRSTESVNSILKASNANDDVSVSSSKKVRFSEAMYEPEACPSSHSELEFDYMKHNFDEQDKTSKNGINSTVEANKRQSNSTREEKVVCENPSDDEFEDDDCFEIPREWYSLLVQAK